jgi:hypothetical protein
MHPEINLVPPAGYQWLIERAIVGFEPFSQIQPWYFTTEKESFWATDRWPNLTDKRLYVFARRQDNDCLACFSMTDNQEDIKIVLIQGWTAQGYTIVKEYSNFWAWFKSVIDDIAEWLNM